MAKVTIITNDGKPPVEIQTDDPNAYDNMPFETPNVTATIIEND